MRFSFSEITEAEAHLGGVTFFIAMQCKSRGIHYVPGMAGRRIGSHICGAWSTQRPGCVCYTFA